MRFLLILAYTVAIPASLLVPMYAMAVLTRFWILLIPFRWREENFSLLLLQFLWVFPWLAFWIWWFTR